ALALSVRYAQQRSARGRNLVQFGGIQYLLAEMTAKIQAGRCLTYEVARLKDKGADIKVQSAVAKLFCSQIAVEVTRMAMQIHGSYGTTKELDVERLYRDAKMCEIYVGSSEILRTIVTKGITSFLTE
ncbi:MAG: acyl-CoA dehydrogenase family protein, partial [candidate division WOR-3 bacterium]